MGFTRWLGGGGVMHCEMPRWLMQEIFWVHFLKHLIWFVPYRYWCFFFQTEQTELSYYLWYCSKDQPKKNFLYWNLLNSIWTKITSNNKNILYNFCIPGNIISISQLHQISMKSVVVFRPYTLHCPLFSILYSHKCRNKEGLTNPGSFFIWLPTPSHPPPCLLGGTSVHVHILERRPGI
jgi:hypothetical protein